MTLLMVDKKDLYHFHSVHDALYWIERNPMAEIAIIEEDEYDSDFQDFLEEHYPLEIITK